MQWFRKLGWLYQPVSFASWLLTAVTIALCIWVFLAVDRNSHSASGTLIGTFPYSMLLIILWNWVAVHTFRGVIRANLSPSH